MERRVIIVGKSPRFDRRLVDRNLEFGQEERRCRTEAGIQNAVVGVSLGR